MDFAKLVGDTGPVDERLEAAEVTLDEFKNGGDDTLKLTLHPMGGTRFKNAIRFAQKRFQYEADDPESGDPKKKSDKEIWAEIGREDDRANELMARMTDGWNLMDGDKPVPYTLQNGKEFYAAARGVYAAVDGKIVEMGNDSKEQKSDSS